MDGRVYVALCRSYERAGVTRGVRQILDHFGTASGILGKGKRVLLKPNLLMDRRPEEATTTHPAVMAAVAEAFIGLGAEVVIADSPGGPFTASALKRVYRCAGMEDVCNETGARLNYDLSSRRVAYPGGRQMKSFEVIRAVLDADVVVGVSKLKTHAFQYYTGAVKNCFGVVPGLTKASYHARIPDKWAFGEMLVDLCECIRPAFSIIDGVMGMDGKGPSGGRAREAGVLIGARNPHAADLAAVRLIGFHETAVPTLTAALARGLMPKDPGALEISKDKAEQIIILPFIPSATATPMGSLSSLLPAKAARVLTKLAVRHPRVAAGTCTGCGECVKICPRKTIALCENKAVIHKKECIKCYCCHEICPQKSIRI